MNYTELYPRQGRELNGHYLKYDIVNQDTLNDYPQYDIDSEDEDWLDENKQYLVNTLVKWIPCIQSNPIP